MRKASQDQLLQCNSSLTGKEWQDYLDLPNNNRLAIVQRELQCFSQPKRRRGERGTVVLFHRSECLPLGSVLPLSLDGNDSSRLFLRLVRRLLMSVRGRRRRRGLTEIGWAWYLCPHPPIVTQDGTLRLSFAIVSPEDGEVVHRLLYATHYPTEPLIHHLGLCTGLKSIPDLDKVVEERLASNLTLWASVFTLSWIWCFFLWIHFKEDGISINRNSFTQL